ncbi:hypothetical protein [Myxococcus sp. RHSTA-1-4]
MKLATFSRMVALTLSSFRTNAAGFAQNAPHAADSATFSTMAVTALG